MEILVDMISFIYLIQDLLLVLIGERPLKKIGMKYINKFSN